MWYKMHANVLFLLASAAAGSASAANNMMMRNKMIRTVKDSGGMQWCVSRDDPGGTNKLLTKYCNPRDPLQRFDIEELEDLDGERGPGRFIFHPSGEEGLCVELLVRENGRRLRVDDCVARTTGGEVDVEAAGEAHQIWTFPKVNGVPDGLVTMMGAGGANATAEDELCVTSRGAMADGHFIIVKTRKRAESDRARGREIVDRWHVVRRTFPETAY